MGELSRALLVSNGNVTGLVRQLEAQGLISQAAAPGDRRSSVVRLTPTGVAHFAKLAAAHHEWVGGMLARVPAEQQEALLELMAVVKASIACDEQE